MQGRRVVWFLGFVSILVFAHSASFATSVPFITDSSITSAIKNKIAAEPAVSALNIIVKASKGIVSLSGNVSSDDQAGILIEIAQATPGVADVDASELGITECNEPFSDRLIAARITGLMKREKLFGENSLPITVESNNGDVHLIGSAESEEQIKRAIAIAKWVKGVRKVEANIQLNTKAKTS